MDITYFFYLLYIFLAGVVEKKSGPKLSCILSIPNAHQFQFDEKICLCLERYRWVDLHGIWLLVGQLSVQQLESPEGLNSKEIYRYLAWNFQKFSFFSYFELIFHVRVIQTIHSGFIFPIFSSPELKAQVSFSDQNLSVVRRGCRCHKLFTFSHLLPQNHWANFNQTWHKASLCKGDSSLFKWRALLFVKGR